jgi:hypothetical protein
MGQDKLQAHNANYAPQTISVQPKCAMYGSSVAFIVRTRTLWTRHAKEKPTESKWSV